MPKRSTFNTSAAVSGQCGGGQSHSDAAQYMQSVVMSNRDKQLLGIVTAMNHIEETGQSRVVAMSDDIVTSSKWWSLAA